jgi:hypothetical protein
VEHEAIAAGAPGIPADLLVRALPNIDNASRAPWNVRSVIWLGGAATAVSATQGGARCRPATNRVRAWFHFAESPAICCKLSTRR